LKTGGNWATGTIGEFKLTVDKGNPKNLVSFCGENVRKTGPTIFEMTADNYYPSRDLEVLILVPFERETDEAVRGADVGAPPAWRKLPFPNPPQAGNGG